MSKVTMYGTALLGSLGNLFVADDAHYSGPRILGGLLVAGLILLACQCMYNALLHPLHRFPGPGLARMSGAWSAYHRSKLDMAHAVRNAHKEYGPVVRIAPNELHFSSPTALRQIYVGGNNSLVKSDFYKAGRIVAEENIFSFRDRNAYAARKRIMAKAFTKANVDAFVQGVAELSEQFSNQMKKRCSGTDGVLTDFYPWLNWFTFEAVYILCFDRQAGMMETGTQHSVMTDMESSKRVFPYNAAFPPLDHFGHLVPISVISDPYKARLRWKKYCLDLLQDARNNTGKTSIISALTDTVDEYLGRNLNHSEATEELMGLQFAGAGTTAQTLVYLYYELARHPELQEDLLEELKPIMPSVESKPMLRFLTALPLLNAIINETLRVYPTIVGMLPRKLTTEMTIDEYYVPKGTVVGMSNGTHHYTEEVYEDAHCWRPSRWLVDDKTLLKSSFSPFSLGQRNCIGQHFSISEMQIVVAALCRKLRFRLAKTQETADMTLLDFFNAAPACQKLELVITARE